MTLPEAQAVFRQSPGRLTALAYMDAAIEAWSTAPHSFYPNGSDRDFTFQLQEIRDWLMNERTP